ncbi:MAG TPA: phosphoenolpyruvate--protein phosphotransferase [Bacteroidetes bacterium]|nr:phosphoenolpyruvate--protein phosphotransferase [Bacteroidota bacterium]HCN36600.1 phosphoenolpyruvate--protein phosphotransferase [Bacteroidota bacterium]
MSEQTFKGIPASPGISMSIAYVYSRSKTVVDISELSKKDIENELLDFEKAIQLSLKELKKIHSISTERIGEEKSKIFDVQIEILNDKLFLNQVKERIIKENRTAGYIFDNEIGKIEKVLMNGDDYLRERISDFNDVKNRVIRNMKREKLVSKVEENSIIVAHELTPADTILFSRRKVQGYITDLGGVTSHAAIIARALRVPAVVGTKNFSQNVLTGDFIIIDGFNGIVILNPTADTIETYGKKLLEVKEYEQKLFKVIDLPSETKDGKKIELSVNIEFDEEIDFVTKYGHCDIGLYRTEHLFLEAGDFPSEAYQIKEYTHISEVTYPKCVTIRTYDIGGDKLLPSSQKEDNPYLGWRGIRICLDREEIFKEQLSAILKASSKKNIKILFPMIYSIDEVRKAKEILEEVKISLTKKGKLYDPHIKVGIMIEVPSAVFLADELAKEVDFFSIGTNDLIQYILAVDRGNERISDRYQEFHPAVIRAVYNVIQSAHKNKIPVSVCGEMASYKLASLVLIGFGADELSVAPSEFTEIKNIIRSINFKELKKFTLTLLDLSTEKEIKKEVNNFYENLIKN